MLMHGRSLTVRPVAAMLLIVVPLFVLGVFLEVKPLWKH